MTEIVITQDAPVLVAIDIAKTRHEVLIGILGNKRRRRAFATLLYNKRLLRFREFGCFHRFHSFARQESSSGKL
ncbi:MAG: hypothetical protein GQ539_08550 [Sulfitobacter sp.]|nr:hypothetical protein [Sulfitobacter sp.]